MEVERFRAYPAATQETEQVRSLSPLVDRTNTPSSARDRKFSMTSALNIAAHTEGATPNKRMACGLVSSRPGILPYSSRTCCSSAASGAESEGQAIMATLLSGGTSLDEGSCCVFRPGFAGARRLTGRSLQRSTPITGQSCRTTLNSELLILMGSAPLYSMKPSFLNLFRKKFTRERVVPTISASVSCEIFGTMRTGTACFP